MAQISMHLLVHVTRQVCQNQMAGISATEQLEAFKQNFLLKINIEV
jgi:hypothetical protein